MEQFEKWWDEHITKALVLYPTLPVKGLKYKYEIVWRTALKEVLKQLNDIYDGDFENSEIVEWINKELGGT